MKWNGFNLEDLEDLETDFDKSPVFDELKALDDFDVGKIDEAEKALAEEKAKAINIQKIEKTIYKLEIEIKTYNDQIEQDIKDIKTLNEIPIESSNIRAKIEQRGDIENNIQNISWIKKVYLYIKWNTNLTNKIYYIIITS